MQAGTDANGFFNEYLILGPYDNPGGAAPGTTAIALDYLDDGMNNEGNILPADGQALGLATAAVRAGFLGDPPPTIRLAAINPANQLLSLNVLLSPNDNVMAYAWIYVNNKSGSPLDVFLALASDDSIQVKVNRIAVLNWSQGRGSGGAGNIQNRVRLILPEGWSFFQFKVFDGNGGWNMRSSTATAAATTSISGAAGRAPTCSRIVGTTSSAHGHPCCSTPSKV